MVACLTGAVVPFAAAAQSAAAPRTILAIGAHAGDMELTAGAFLIKQHELGDRVFILHMTLGEGGNPRLSPAIYGAQKRREALAADSVIGAEAIFAPYRDGEIPDDEAVRRYVADVIRAVKPSYIVTHWSHSIHKDHSRTSLIVQDAVLLASLEGVVTGHPPHRGVRGVYYADNWDSAGRRAARVAGRRGDRTSPTPRSARSLLCRQLGGCRVVHAVRIHRRGGRNGAVAGGGDEV
jgi:LmbE family N-acetylglucosaminyl deacetylase